MSFYSCLSSAGLPGCPEVWDGLVAVRVGDVVAGVARTGGRRGGGRALAGRRSLLTVGPGSGPVGQGDRVVVLRPVLEGIARVRDDGRIEVEGQAADFVRLGLVEAEIDRLLGDGAIDRLVAELSPATDGSGAGADPGRVFTWGLVVRVLAGMLMPEASWDDVLATLFGVLGEVAFTGRGAVPTGAGFAAARRGLPAGLMAALSDRLLGAVRAELAADGGQALGAGLLTLAGFDGTLVRLPDTAANRERFGAGTDPAPFPHVRVLAWHDAGTKAPLGYAYGPASGTKDASEQALLTQVATGPAGEDLARADLLHVGDRNFPGAGRLRRLAADGWNLLVRLPSALTVRRTGDRFDDGSFLADLGTGDVLTGWRVVEYDVFADGVHTGETYAVASNVTDPAVLPAGQAADAYRARWGATETPLRAAKSTITGAGPGTGPMLRATDPFEVDQELPAWVITVSALRALQRTTAARATPAARGRRAGQPVLVRELSFTATRHAAVRGFDATTAGLPPEIVQARLRRARDLLGRRRETLDRPRARPRAAKSPSDFPTARADITTTTNISYELRICGATPHHPTTAVTDRVDTPPGVRVATPPALTAVPAVITLPTVTNCDHTPDLATAA